MNIKTPSRLAVSALAVLMSGCAGTGGSINSVISEKTKRVEYYRIYDFKTAARPLDMIAAASKGLSRNTTNLNESRPIPKGGPLPEAPGRFTVVDALAGTQLAGFAALAGGAAAQFKRAGCDGAAWIAQAQRGDGRDSRIDLSVCLWQYSGGYHLDFYANFMKKEGGFFEISRSAAAALIGTPEQWVETTFNDTLREMVVKSGAKPIYIEGFPEPLAESGAATSDAAPYASAPQ